MKLTEAEQEFIAEMSVEPQMGGWHHFDPPFLKKHYRRLVEKGWFKIVGDGRYTEFAWTPAGRQALKGGDHG